MLAVDKYVVICEDEQIWDDSIIYNNDDSPVQTNQKTVIQKLCAFLNRVTKTLELKYNIHYVIIHFSHFSIYTARAAEHTLHNQL